MNPSDKHSYHNHSSNINDMAISATLHCLTGCAIGETLGMIIGTVFGWPEGKTIFLAVVLAFVFGYTLTSIPLFNAGFPLKQIVSIALATDTLSILAMEIIDNLIMFLIPGAMKAGLANILFWGSLAFALGVAALLTVPVNRWLIKKGKGHMALHEVGIHGGPPIALLKAIYTVVFLFGIIVLSIHFLFDF